MKKAFLFSLVMFGISIVSVASAADLYTGSASCPYGNMESLTGIVTWAGCFLMQSILPFLFTLATAGFIYRLVKFFLNPENAKQKEDGKTFITGGLIALFMMVSVWGIVEIFTNTFEIKNAIPQLPTTGNE